MGKPSFTVFVGVSDKFSVEDIAKLPPNLRKAYSLCSEWEPGEEIIVEGLRFNSFDRGRDDTADPGEYAGFGTVIFAQQYDRGAPAFNDDELKSIESVHQKVAALFNQLGLDVEVRVFCFPGYNS